MAHNLLEHVSLMVVRQFNKIGPLKSSKHISKSDIIDMRSYFNAESFEIDGKVYKGQWYNKKRNGMGIGIDEDGSLY
jgi:hypothetical protein